MTFGCLLFNHTLALLPPKLFVRDCVLVPFCCFLAVAHRKKRGGPVVETYSSASCDSAGQLKDAQKTLSSRIDEINLLPASEQKLYLGEVRVAETRLATLNLVLCGDSKKLQDHCLTWHSTLNL